MSRKGSKAALLRVEPERNAYRPGERVRGTVTATENRRARSLTICLSYVDASNEYTERTDADTIVIPIDREIRAGEPHAFDLRLPDEALPAFAHSERKHLGWEVWALLDIPRGLDAAANAPIELETESPPVEWDPVGLRAPGHSSVAGGWAIAVVAGTFAVVFAAGGAPAILAIAAAAIAVLALVVAYLRRSRRRRISEAWDVEAVLRGLAEIPRGGRLELDVRVGEPWSGRDGISAALICYEHYATTTTDSEGNETRTTSKRKAFESTQAVDGGAPESRLSFEIPADAPFSHESGKALAFRWRLELTEDRRGADPFRELPLRVLP